MTLSVTIFCLLGETISPKAAYLNSANPFFFYGPYLLLLLFYQIGLILSVSFYLIFYGKNPDTVNPCPVMPLCSRSHAAESQSAKKRPRLEEAGACPIYKPQLGCATLLVRIFRFPRRNGPQTSGPQNHLRQPKKDRKVIFGNFPNPFTFYFYGPFQLLR